MNKKTVNNLDYSPMFWVRLTLHTSALQISNEYATNKNTCKSIEFLIAVGAFLDAMKFLPENSQPN